MTDDGLNDIYLQANPNYEMFKMATRKNSWFDLNFTLLIWIVRVKVVFCKYSVFLIQHYPIVKKAARDNGWHNLTLSLLSLNPRVNESNLWGIFI